MKASLVVILFIYIVYGESCTCNLRIVNRPKLRYCRADYGIKVRVLDTVKSGKVRRGTGSRYYRIKVLNKKQFLKLKPALNEKVMNKKWVRTEKDEGVCGIRLRKGNTYLLAGKVVKQPARSPIPDYVLPGFAPESKKYELHVDLCNVFSLWKDIKNGTSPGFNVKFVTETYKTSCSK